MWDLCGCYGGRWRGLEACCVASRVGRGTSRGGGLFQFRCILGISLIFFRFCRGGNWWVANLVASEHETGSGEAFFCWRLRMPSSLFDACVLVECCVYEGYVVVVVVWRCVSEVGVESGELWKFC